MRATASELVASALLIGSLAALLSQAWRADFAYPADLRAVSGTIDEVKCTWTTRGGSALHLVVRSGHEMFEYTQDDMRADVPALGTLKRGDLVTLLIQEPWLPTTAGVYWAVSRGEQMVLTYEDTKRWRLIQKDRSRVLAAWAGALAVGFAVFGLALRISRGSWQ
jgi:hypothetical protein